MKKIFLKIVLLLILANVGFGDVIQILGGNYSIYKGNVYYGNESIGRGIKDPKTFEFLPNGIIYDVWLYGKDKYNVYYIENKMINCFNSYYFIYEVKGINKDKVEVLNKWFIKDDKNIYFKGKILEGADYNKFEVLPNGNGKDKNQSYK